MIDNTQEDRRESKLTAMRESATPSDRIKLAEITAATREAAARAFGSRVSDLMVNRLVESVLLTEKAVVTVKSNFDQMPKTRAGWDALVKSEAEKDVWVKANLVSSDNKLRDELRREAMATLTPARTIHLARTGDLDGYIRNYTNARIDARLDALR